MIVFARSRHTLNTVVAVALLAGCAGSQPPMGALVTTPQDRAQPPAAPDAKQAPCIYLLSTSEASDLSNTKVVGPKCSFYINDRRT